MHLTCPTTKRHYRLVLSCTRIDNVHIRNSHMAKVHVRCETYWVVGLRRTLITTTTLSVYDSNCSQPQKLSLYISQARHNTASVVGFFARIV
jgi:hypothetical protein